MSYKKIWSLVLFIVVTDSVVFAQNDPQAKAILNGVSKKYRSFNVVKIEFSFNLKSPQANVNETQNGTLYVKPASNKYKVNLDEQELISDGKVQWTYLKKDHEVQIAAINNSTDAMNPAKIFTLYEKGFKYVYLGDTKLKGKTYQNIELAPLQNRPYSKVKLKIDKLAKQIVNIVVFDKNGNTYTYNVKSFIPNVKINDSFFSFDASKHPGVDVVDLR
ncbi:MAG: outer membrane lipoprotein carrier protein LolA [Sphingobacteriales bacterium]|nr:outer membrane lipoprotein carrier protein LolA [Sphingobacteriales bacterium]